ncbi:MAG TPA: FtsX-like permease family protein [Methanocella sp.]|nr:FtsX-like permease family protein [Methanocella sp.]
MKSFRMRKARYVLPIIALIIGISVGSAFLMVSLDIQDKVATELRNFGPNLVVVPHSEDIQLTVGGLSLGSISETKYISESDAKKIRDLPLSAYGNRVKGILGENAFVYSVVKADGKQDVILAGTWFDQLEKINTWWDIEGQYPADNSSVVLGKTAAEKLDKKVGDMILLEYHETVTNATGTYDFTASKAFTVSGIASTGGEDDSRIFGDLDAVQGLTNKENKVNIMQISAICNECPVEDVAAIIEQNIDGIDVLTVKQVAKAEMNTLEMVQNLVGFITVVALSASALTVMTTQTLSVVERRKEIGLMKAVGAKDLNVASFFIGEGLIIAVIGALLGFGLGAAVAQFIGEYVFHSSIHIVWWVLPASVIMAVAVVTLASLIPIKQAVGVDPAIVLRGE